MSAAELNVCWMACGRRIASDEVVSQHNGHYLIYCRVEKLKIERAYSSIVFDGAGPVSDGGGRAGTGGEVNEHHTISNNNK